MGDADRVVHLSPEVYNALSRLAERRGVSLEEVLVETLSLGKAAAEAKLQGSRLLIETHGRVRELVS
jgi:hypothetical protein